MLPSSGYFKNVLCPFFKVGLCVRPHCHYKHEKLDDTEERSEFSSVADEAEYLLEADSKSSLLNLLSKSSYSQVTVEHQENATYVPTPVGKCSKPQGILKTNNSNVNRPSTSTIPEYKPTPISKLKELNIPLSNADEHSSITATRKKKKIDEYDPTEVKCVSKKSVTFADQTSNDIVSEFLPPVIFIESSDDDMYDTSSAPKFSDDDLEEDVSEQPRIDNSAAIKKEEKKESSDEEAKIDEFSLVDKILVDCKKNEKFLTAYRKPVLSSEVSKLPPKLEKQPAALNKVQKSEANIVNLIPDLIELSNNSGIACTSQTKDISVEKDSSSENSKSKKHGNKEKKENKKESDKSKIEVKSSDKNKKSSKTGVKTEKNHKKSNSDKDRKSDKHKKASNIEKTKHPHDEKIKHSVSTSKKSSLKKKHLSSSSDKKESKLQDGKVSSSSVVKKVKKSTLDHYSVDSDISKTKDKHDLSKHVVKAKRKFEIESQIESLKKCKSSPSLEVSKQSDSSIDEDDEKNHGNASDISESDVDEEEQCRKFYDEFFQKSSEDNDISGKEVPSKRKSPENEDLLILRKKRLAHSGASSTKRPSAKEQEVKRHLSPAQVMHNRYAQLQAMYARQNETKNVPSVSTNRPVEKVRINAPNRSLLAAVAQKNMLNQNASTLGDFSPLPPTVSKTLKTNQRVAHVPDVALKPRPIIPACYGSKVPANVRQKFLNAFIDECLKFHSNEDDAYETALEEEKKAYERSSCKALYMNVAANTLKRLRNKAEEAPLEDNQKHAVATNISVKQKNKTVSHETVLNGPLAQRTSFSIGQKKQLPEIKGGAVLYEYLLPYVLTEEQLKEHGFPLPHPTEADRAVIEGIYANKIQYCNDPFRRMCCRCQKVYYVNVDGDYVREEECDFHWGRLWKRRIAGAIESRYSCCQGDAESDGCCVSPGHVFEGSENHAFKGFVKTLPKTPPPDKCYGIYALDCEMCYTTAGMELTRVTVIGSDFKPVYESFVKPKNKVLDYNTRFSGITEDDLKNVRTTLLDVQAVLLCIFNDKTILIGHSLESDFKALKLFHKTVVDTSVVFPHKNGLPFKRALKTLMAEKLNKIIQNDVGGHDSHEDAASCMELMLWKIKEDVKSNR